MNWLVWQQHRKQFLIFGILAIIFAAVVIPSGVHMWQTYQQALANCDAQNNCNLLSSTLFKHGFEHAMFLIVKAVMIALPIVLGVFWGVPLIAKEYIDGTNKLIWTQSVSRKTWLTAKLAWVLGVTVVVAGVFAAIATWWSQTGNTLYNDRFNALNFGVQGIAPIGYAVFAVALGILVGVWLKRTFVALGVMLAILLAVQLAFPLAIRQHYIPAKTASITLKDSNSNVSQPPMPENNKGAWVISGQVVDGSGKPINWSNPPQACRADAPGPNQTAADRAKGVALKPGDAIVGADGGAPSSFLCLKEHGYSWSVRYQASDEYWKFQLIETGIYILFAVMCLGLTYRLVLSRDV
jgi:ABC-type transport system involved in multi-copper enzyme maturation permease subunit